MSPSSCDAIVNSVHAAMGTKGRLLDLYGSGNAGELIASILEKRLL